MDDERIEIRWFSKTQLADLIRTGKVLDGKTMIGYFLWLEYKRRAGNRLFAR
jgi:ADP-ribose pyrophosphatase